MCYDGDMKLIVGLGNPGSEYNFTRHNFGFLALDFYAKVKGLGWEKPKLGAIWLKDGERIFVKPQDFYNNSGVPAANFMRYYKIAPEDVLVICDDFDMEFGKIRYREHGSSGGNNGLKSLTHELKTEMFPRLRIGTNNAEVRKRLGDMEFVLGHFTAEEKERLPEILQRVVREIDRRTL